MSHHQALIQSMGQLGIASQPIIPAARSKYKLDYCKRDAKVGTENPPPDLISSVDPGYAPKHSIPENIERMTGDTQKMATEGGPNKEIGVGELEGAKFKLSH